MRMRLSTWLDPMHQITACNALYHNCLHIKLPSSHMSDCNHPCTSNCHLLHVSCCNCSHVPSRHDLRLSTYGPSAMHQASVLHLSSTSVVCVSCAIPASHRTFTHPLCTIYLYFYNSSLLLLTWCIACPDSSVP